MLQSKYMPLSHFSETHSIEINKRPEHIWPLVEKLDFGGSLVTRILCAFRGMPSKMISMEGLERAGFMRLETLRDEMIIGLIGQFWKPSGNLQAFRPTEFTTYNLPGFSKATWSFRVTGNNGTSTLETETRIYCTDDKARRRFQRYWFIIRPFSGIIRKEILKGIRRKAEKL